MWDFCFHGSCMILLCSEILCALRSLLWDLLFFMGSYMMMTLIWNSAARSQPGLCFDSYLLYDSLSCVHVLGDCTTENLFWWVVAAWHDSQSCEIVLQDHSQSHLFCTTTFMNTFIWLKDFWPQIVGSSCTELLLSLSVKLWLGDYHSRRRSLEGSIFLGAYAVCIQSSALLFFTTNDKSFEMYTSKKTLWCFFYWICSEDKRFPLRNS